MNRKNKMILGAFTAIVFVVLFIASSYFLAADGSDVNREEPVVNSNVNSLQIPEASAAGGYEITTDNFHCLVAVDGEYKYSCFESYGSDRKVELYASPTEMVLIDKNGDVTKYYSETYEDIDQVYTNPLKRVYDELQALEFEQVDNVVLDGIEYETHKAIQIVETVKQKQVAYNVYSVEMDWIDGEHYAYKYYEYADGSTLISAEAPNEINPRLNSETKWIVDLDAMHAYNSDTEEFVELVVTAITSGEGLSPDSDESTTVKHTQTIYAYTMPGTNQIVKLNYSSDGDGTNVDIIENADIVKPMVADDAEKMDNDTLQVTIMLVAMLDSLI